MTPEERVIACIDHIRALQALEDMAKLKQLQKELAKQIRSLKQQQQQQQSQFHVGQQVKHHYWCGPIHEVRVATVVAIHKTTVTIAVDGERERVPFATLEPQLVKMKAKHGEEPLKRQRCG